MKIIDITIGADPELFITKSNKVVSSIGLIPGTKEEPYVADDMPDGFAMETDNILAEFNIPPCETREAFVNSINYMKEYIKNYLKAKDPKYDILCTASRIVAKSELNSEEAQQFGCDPDYNVYTCKVNPKPNGNATNMRSAGFHVHLGYKRPNIDTSLGIVKYLDTYLGVPSVIKDPDSKRRELYGKAGCFRLCSYGVEYRVLSSAMMAKDDLIEFVWNQVMKAIDAYNCEINIPNSNLVCQAINNSDSTLANKLIKCYDLI